MKKRIGLTILAVLLGGSVQGQQYDLWSHGAPPADDEYLVKRFGLTWGQPIYSGYLIVRGQYVDAPYVVEQRGYGIFINNVKVENAVDLRTLFPVEKKIPVVTSDPGLPVGLTATNTIGDAVRHPVTDAKRHYWDQIGLRGQARVDAEIAYFRQLPCIARVDNPYRGPMGTVIIDLYDHRGNRAGTAVQSEKPKPWDLPSDEQVLSWAVRARERYEIALRRNKLVRVGDNGIFAENYGPTPDERWREIFKTLAGKLSPEAKVVKLKELGFLQPYDSVETTKGFDPITTSLGVSDQIWQRLSGDAAWTNGAAERVHALTNGWKTVSPNLRASPAKPESRARTNAVKRVRMPVRPMPAAPAPEVQPITEPPSPVVVPAEAKPTAVPVSTPPPPRGKGVYGIWLAALLVGLGGLVWVGARLRK